MTEREIIRLARAVVISGRYEAFRFADLHDIGRWKGDSWYPDDPLGDYFLRIRTPSNQFPHSYQRAALTKKFMKWFRQKYTDRLGDYPDVVTTLVSMRVGATTRL